MKQRSCRLNHYSSILVFSLLSIAGVTLAENLEWISLDGSSEGSPAELVVETSLSSEGKTVLELKVPGFWMEDRLGDDGRYYKKITVPGMGSLGQTGAPALPTFRSRLGVITSAQEATVEQFDILAMESFFDVLIWPQPIEELEPIEGGQPERFAIDWQIYDSQDDFPAEPTELDTDFGTSAAVLRTIGLRLQPFSWNPTDGKLEVVSHGRWVIYHLGEVPPITPLTRDRFAMARSVLDNWGVIGGAVPVNWWHYDADYLIITPEAYHPTLQSFIDLKKAQGYWVQVRYIENTGSGCEDIRTAIADWYWLAPESRDKYCLLVGDVDVLPTCTSPFLNWEDYPDGVPTDDAYGSVNGYDLDEEVYVGRLSVNDEPDLAQQLARIIEYQTGGLTLLADHKQVALVAHKEDAPGKYVGAHESVRTAYYSDPPIFQTYYGSQSGVSNADVSAAINSGLGLVAYRGHGSRTSWTNWNTYGEYYSDSDVDALTNTQHPVVWSFSCSNGKLESEYCIAEKWMEKGDHGAVSHYGSTEASYTSQNHELDRQMFQAVYNLGLTVQGQAIEYGEERYVSIHGGRSNAWMYLLLGDPSMRIRTHGPITVAATPPDYVPTGPFILDLYFYEAESGFPIPDAIFSVWKPAPGREDVDEVFDNHYTAPDGHVTLSVEPQTEGMLYWALRGPDGECVMDSIPVFDGTDAPDWQSEDERFWADPSVTTSTSTLRFGGSLTTDAHLSIYDVSGRAVRWLHLPAGGDEIVWDGRDEQGARVSGGIYFARVRAGEMEKVTRITMLR